MLTTYQNFSLISYQLFEKRSSHCWKIAFFRTTEKNGRKVRKHKKSHNFTSNWHTVKSMVSLDSETYYLASGMHLYLKKHKNIWFYPIYSLFKNEVSLSSLPIFDRLKKKRNYTSRKKVNEVRMILYLEKKTLVTYLKYRGKFKIWNQEVSYIAEKKSLKKFLPLLKN